MEIRKFVGIHYQTQSMCPQYLMIYLEGQLHKRYIEGQLHKRYVKFLSNLLQNNNHVVQLCENLWLGEANLQCLRVFSIYDIIVHCLKSDL